MNLSLSEDAIPDKTLRRITFDDPNYDGKYALVAVEDGKPIGFVLGVRRRREPKELVDVQRNLAWVKVFAVKEEYRGKGVATALFDELEERLREDESERVRVSDYSCGIYSVEWI
nr:GNAT family N-acetyltransferase [Infirmifilum lucidum]